MKRDPNQCAICGHPLLANSKIPLYCCKADWEIYKPAVLAKEPWVKFLRLEERRRRERRQKVQKLKIVEVPWRKEYGGN